MLPLRSMKTKKEGVQLQRVIDVEKATFTTLVLSTHGGIGPYAEKFNNRLAYCMQRSLLKN